VARARKTISIILHEPEPGERLTDEQYDRAEDIALKHLGLRINRASWLSIRKKGRTHRHVAVFRVDEDGKAISDSLTYRKHEAAAREIEHEMGLNPMQSFSQKREQPRRKDVDAIGKDTGAASRALTRSRCGRSNKAAKGSGRAAILQRSDGPARLHSVQRRHADYCFVDPAAKSIASAGVSRISRRESCANL